MNRWIYRTKKWCALAVCAMLIPHGYEAVRQTVLGWPRKEAQESVISDAYIVKKQSFEAGTFFQVQLLQFTSVKIESHCFQFFQFGQV